MVNAKNYQTLKLIVKAKLNTHVDEICKKLDKS